MHFASFILALTPATAAELGGQDGREVPLLSDFP